MKWIFLEATDLGAHANDWDRINQEGPASPLLDVAFALSALKNFGSGREVLAVLNPERPQAMALLRQSGKMGWETFQPSQAPLGFFVHDGRLHVPFMLQTLMKQLPGLPLILGVTQLDPLLYPVPPESPTLKSVDYIRTAGIVVIGTFEDYWQKRGRNLRHNLKKQRAQLEKQHVKPCLDLITDPAEVSQAIRDYSALEQSGWKAGKGTAVHHNNVQGEFYRTLLKRFCRKGLGRIYRYRYNESVVAMDLCVEFQGTLVVLKTAYDERISNNTSPALLMRQDAFQQIFEEGKISRIEFYGRVMDWHTKWADETRVLYHLNQYRWSVLSMLHGQSPKIETEIA